MRRTIIGTALLLALFIGASAAAAPAKKGDQAKAKQVQVTGLININTASVDELILLPGIGEKKAERIVEKRQKSPYQSVSQLRRVKGIGPKLLRKLQPYLTVKGKTTLQKAK